jgi:hypothetical protein
LSFNRSRRRGGCATTIVIVVIIIVIVINAYAAGDEAHACEECNVEQMFHWMDVFEFNPRIVAKTRVGCASLV